MKRKLKLFRVTVAITHKFTEDLVVAAEDGASALEYMKKNPEWKEDGALEAIRTGAATMEPVAAKLIRDSSGLPTGASEETIVWWDGCSSDFAPQLDVKDIFNGVTP